VISPRGTDPSFGPHSLSIAQVTPPRLRCSQREIYLAVVHQYRIIEDDPTTRGPWRVQSVGYSYILHGEGGKELFAYQWHPGGPSPITSPHVHIGTGLGLTDLSVPKLHVPTARVSLEQVIRLAIELGAEPIRDDWDEVLRASEDAFIEWRSWR
jgi:hypothetical protein